MLLHRLRAFITECENQFTQFLKVQSDLGLFCFLSAANDLLVTNTGTVK